MLKHDFDWWKKMIWIDEFTMKMNVRRNQVWVIKKKNEMYYFNCVNIRFFKYTNLMFWNCFVNEMREFYHFFVEKIKNEKNVVQNFFQNINSEYNVEI